MKIGDKVRFLNDVGGGVVSGFQDKDLVLVRDADGFDIPVLARECVVIETDEYNLARPAAKPRGGAKAPAAVAKAAAGVPAASAPVRTVAEEPAETEPADRPVTFRPRAAQRRGGDALNIYIGFVRMDAEAMGEERFEVYLVNDSNYDFRFSVLSCENAACELLHEDLAEANTKLFLRELPRTDLAAWERLQVQGFAYKAGLPFLPKPAVTAPVRVDGARFFRPGAFRESLFFNEPALVIDVVRDDKPADEAGLSPQRIKEMLREKEAGREAARPAAKAAARDRNASVEVDLHASEILETTAGMQPRDILEYQLDVFRRTMREHAGEKGRRLVFIHGKGDGVLRAAILKELRAAYKHCTWQDASFREYGFGATMVVVR